MLTETEVFPLQEFPLLIRLRDLNNAKPFDGDMQDLLIERIHGIS
jgi:hypothetical protein